MIVIEKHPFTMAKLCFYYTSEISENNYQTIPFQSPSPDTVIHSTYVVAHKELLDRNTHETKGQIVYDYISVQGDSQPSFSINMNRLTLTTSEGSLIAFGTKLTQFTPIGETSYYTIIAGNGIYQGITSGSIRVTRVESTRRNVVVCL